MSNVTQFLSHDQIRQMILNVEQAKPAGPMIHALITIVDGADPVCRTFPSQFDLLVAAKNKVMPLVAGLQAPHKYEIKLVSGSSAWTWKLGGGNEFVGVGSTRSLKIWKEARTA